MSAFTELQQYEKAKLPGGRPPGVTEILDSIAGGPDSAMSGYLNARPSYKGFLESCVNLVEDRWWLSLVRLRAYEKWGDRGRPLWDDHRDWYEAEKELKRIRQRAFELWEQRGRPSGDDQSDWYQAEKELLEFWMSQCS